MITWVCCLKKKSDTRIDLENNHFVDFKDGRIEFGYFDVDAKNDVIGFTSVPVTIGLENNELKAVGELLLAGADWTAINAVLLSIDNQKTGKQGDAWVYLREKVAEEV